MGSSGIAGDDFQRFRKSPFGLSRHGYSKRKFDIFASSLTKNQKRKVVSKGTTPYIKVYIKDA